MASNGKTITSCYFKPIEANDGFEKAADLTPEQWGWFVEIANAAKGEPFGVRPLAKLLGVKVTTFAKRVDVLRQAGWLTKEGEEYEVDVSGFATR